MQIRSLSLALSASGLALASTFAGAAPATPAPTEVVMQSTDYGTLSLPSNRNFSLTLAPDVSANAASDYFLSDYGFTINSTSALSSAVLTFDLGNVFQLTNLTVSLLQGSAWTGAVPSTLTAAQVADIQSRTLWSGTSGAATQVLDVMPLNAGSYVIEVNGQVSGSAGGSFVGVLNVAAVPEPAGVGLMMVGGLGLAALARRRARRQD